MGSGTYGTVYEAINNENGKTVAINKIYEIYKPWQICYDTEVKALIKFGDHPNIIKLKEAIKDDSDNTMYLIFEYMHSNLHDFIQFLREKGKTFSESHIKKLCFQILRGLDHMHKNGYFHRDLKPQNLLISKSGDELKIADFDTVRVIDYNTSSEDNIGTRWYQAPEVLLGSRNYGPGVDMWAVGLILAELLRGSPMIPGTSRDDQVYKICRVLGLPSVSDRVSLGKQVNKKYKIPQVKSSAYKSIASLMPSASEDAISLFKSLCSWDPSKRPSASEALKHRFFSTCYPVPFSISPAMNEKKEENKSINTCLMPPPPGFPSISKVPLPLPGFPSISKVPLPPPGFSIIPKVPLSPSFFPSVLESLTPLPLSGLQPALKKCNEVNT